MGTKVTVKVQVENDAGTVAHYTNATLQDGNNASEVGELWQFVLTDKEMETNPSPSTSWWAPRKSRPTPLLTPPRPPMATPL